MRPRRAAQHVSTKGTVMSVTLLLVVAAFVCAIANALGKCPAWVPIILLCIIHLLLALPR